MRIVAVLLLLILTSCTTTRQAGPPEDYSLVNESCFQVVVEKPTQDSLSYDRPLRWDLVDFNLRNDKYIPLGTAFAISSTELVTAAHVLSLTEDSLAYKKRFIRAKVREGEKSVERVYEVADVRALSTNRDYVVFTVRGKTFDKWLKVETRVAFNRRIYTAGDAYGEGIVIREGVLLDRVPEQEDGKWNYYKSSVATNPGSSGGPLMDEKFNVIGIVLARKDDFCYSLPMTEVVPGRALVHTRSAFGFAVFGKKRPTTMDVTWDLPLGYTEFIQKYTDGYNKFYEEGMTALFDENRDSSFPDSRYALKALYNGLFRQFPQIYLQDTDTNEWFLSDLSPNRSDIGANGSVSWGQIYKDAWVWLMQIRRPDGVTVRELYDSPKKAMDTILKGVNISRKLTENDQGSRITSYGEPIDVSLHTDRYGRTWKLSTWLLEYNDTLVTTVALPTPDGLALLYVSGNSNDRFWLPYDLKKLVDYVGISYGGHLDEWQAFLQQKDFLFGPMKQVSMSYRENGSLDIATHDYAIRVSQSTMKITGKSNLFLGLTLFPKGGKVTWGIQKTVIDESDSTGTKNYCVVYRWNKPDEALPDSFKAEWQKSVLEHGYPYDARPFSEEGRTNIGTLFPSFLTNGRTVVPNDYVYTIFAAKEGAVPDEQMQRCLRDLAESASAAP